MNVIKNIDSIILQFIQMHIRNSFLDKIMPLITNLGSGITIWGMIGVIFVIRKRYRKYGLMIIASLILCFIVGNLSLKPLVGRIRPFDAAPLLDALLVKPPKDFSFPSGHTMCSFAPAVIIYHINKRVGAFSLILSALIGFSRLYLYVHYPSDVFCGMIIGILLGLATIKMYYGRDNIDQKTKDIC